MLEPAGGGVYALRKEFALPSGVAGGGDPVRFVVSGEISTIYKKDGKTRKVHHVILLPGLDEAEELAEEAALEELVLRKYPAEIKELNERIAGYEQDSTHLAEHPKPAEGIAPMVLGGVIYTERENAGKAIIEACTHMNGAETVSSSHTPPARRRFRMFTPRSKV